MTLEDVSGFDMASTRSNRDKVDWDIPLKRLNSDDDIKKIYNFGRKLGQGGFGVVYEATHIETQTKWAIKEICRPEAGSWKVKMLEHEIHILKQVNHAHVIHLQEVYNTSKMIYLVTELCVGGELKQLLLQRKFFSEDETKHIICCLADAVDYLHKRNIVHRDLKLENILVKNAIVDNNDKINIKVTDFGLSVQTNGLGIDHILTESCGTLTYMAPEIMSGRGYSHWCDVWSMGVIIYLLLCGEPPFVSKTKSKLLEEITEKGVRFTQSVWATVSDAAKKILTCLLNVDPSYRMSPSQLLENPWITGDTSVPATPCNVLEMMRQHLEEKDSAQTLEDLSLSSYKETSDVSQDSGAASAESTHTKFSSGTDSSISITTTPKSHHLLQQDKSANSEPSEPSGPPQTAPTQSPPGVKLSTDPVVKQCVGAGQKTASCIRKVAKSPSCSCKTKSDVDGHSARSKNNTPKQQNKKP